MTPKQQKNLRHKLSHKPDLTINPAHLNETIDLTRAAYHSRRKVRPVSFLTLLLGQLRFIARPVWLLQGLLLLGLCVIIRAQTVNNTPEEYIPGITAVASIFIAMTALPFYGRSQKYKIWEVESAARISRSWQTLTRLCVIGAGDAVCLSVIIVLSAQVYSSPAYLLLTYIILPFSLACCGILFSLNRLHHSYGLYVSAGFCTALGIALWTLAIKAQNLLIEVTLIPTVILCMALLVLLFHECRRMLRNMSSDEISSNLENI